MQLKQKLMEDMKQAMRDRDALKLSALRFLLAEIKNKEIDDGELDDAKITAIISKQVKQIREVMADFEKANKTDVVAEEQAKIAVLESYLPQQLSPEELEVIVDSVIAATEPKEMGPIMNAVRAKVAGRADGSVVAQMVKNKLTA